LQARFSVDQSFSSITHESAHYSADDKVPMVPGVPNVPSSPIS
jgi:hypothetical protein